MNRAIITGNLTRDPELRTTARGISVCTFTLAVKRPRTKEDKTDFIPVVTWRGLADNCAKYLAKGRKALAEGMIQIRDYEDRDGNKRYVTELHAENVEFLTPKGQESSRQAEVDNIGMDEYDGDFEPLDDEQMPF
ncbi:MAG: single-stranded DNA-binding protein [Christensenellales bacterium]|jgi:single-strand DNA-binding protein